MKAFLSRVCLIFISLTFLQASHIFQQDLPIEETIGGATPPLNMRDRLESRESRETWILPVSLLLRGSVVDNDNYLWGLTVANWPAYDSVVCVTLTQAAMQYPGYMLYNAEIYGYSDDEDLPWGDEDILQNYQLLMCTEIYAAPLFRVE